MNTAAGKAEEARAKDLVGGPSRCFVTGELFQRSPMGQRSDQRTPSSGSEGWWMTRYLLVNRRLLFQPQVVDLDGVHEVASPIKERAM